MNLLTSPWIPVRRASGKPERIAPTAITDDYDNDRIVEITSARPDFDAALTQFLVGFLQTCLPPDTPRGWRKRFDGPPSSHELEAAALPHLASFELFGDGQRFMQDRTLVEHPTAKIVGIERLAIEAPGDNTEKLGKAHFVRSGVLSSVCGACAASLLYTLQTFSPSGGQGHRQGPRGGGPLSTLVWKDGSLWKALWLNVLPREAAEAVCGNPDQRRESAMFPWAEGMIDPEQDRGRTLTPEDVHPWQLFWGTPRRIWLDSEDADVDCDVCGERAQVAVRTYRTRPQGLDYTGSWAHTLSPTRVLKTGDTLALRTPKDGVGFREWLGLVVHDESRQIAPAAIVRALWEESDRRDRGAPVQIWAHGYEMDNMKARRWHDARMPLHLDSSVGVETVREGIRCRLVAAREVARWTADAVASARPGGRRSPEVEQRFWQDADIAFRAHLDRLSASGNDPDTERRDWMVRLQRSAESVFTAATDSEMLPGARPDRVARAWRTLFKKLNGKALKELLA